VERHALNEAYSYAYDAKGSKEVNRAFAELFDLLFCGWRIDQLSFLSLEVSPTNRCADRRTISRS
jgi:hypothetical protein